MRNRHISNNISLVLDFIDYPHLYSDKSFILFLDFHKAFDTVEHHFIFSALKKNGFGNYFIKTIKTLYFNGNCSIKLGAGTSPGFRVNPISLSYPFPFPFPFILPLALVPRNRVVSARGVNIPLWNETPLGYGYVIVHRR